MVSSSLNSSTPSRRFTSSLPSAVSKLRPFRAQVFIPILLLLLLLPILSVLPTVFLSTLFLNRNSAAFSPSLVTSSLPSLLSLPSDSKCPFPLVYNKPPKTGSTYTQAVIKNWTETPEVPYKNYQCSIHELTTAASIHECLPRRGDPCGVLNCHVILKERMRDILQTRLPNYRVITTTRYPAHRIMSFFMQTRHIRSHELADNMQHLRAFFKWFNPWRMYNWHSGELRTGKCPLTYDEYSHVFNLVAQFDIVVNVALPEESNAILKHFGLFQFPLGEDVRMINVRGTMDMQLSDEIRDMVRSVSCVEDVLHKALLVRMGSLYELATGTPCVKHGHREILESCMEKAERKALNGSWF